MISQKRIENLVTLGKRISAYSVYKYKLGAVIFKGRKIISTGFNKNKTHPKTERYFKHGSVHAEFDAVLHANPDDLKGASILVCRSIQSGKPAIAKPCAMCVQILHEFGIKNAYWTISELPYWNYDSIKNLYNRIDKKEALKNNQYLTNKDS